MARNDTTYQVAALKAATFNLTSTPVEKLPNIVSSLCAQLATCRQLLAKDKDSVSKNESESITHIHRLKTRISSLLQDRSPEARWAGAVLAKTAIECGGLTILQDSLPWVRSLLSMLSRYDPTATRRLAIICLTRIFLLTQGYQTLTREITTPNLPSFVGSCCQLLNSVPELVQTICSSFSQLIGRHPTMFRPHLNQLRSTLSSLVAPATLHLQLSDTIVRSAQTLFIQLHECAPKNAGASEWAVGLGHATTCAHEDVDQVFRSVFEDWESSSGYHPTQHSLQALSTEPARTEKDTLGLSPWTGVQQGGRRVAGLLNILRCYIDTHTTFSTNVNIGAVLDLTRRILSLARPAQTRDWEANGRADTRFDRKERDELVLILPMLHIAAIRVAGALLKRLGTSVLGVAEAVLEQSTFIFAAEKSLPEVREAIYSVIGDALHCIGPGIDKASIASLNDVATQCCHDLLPTSTAHKDLATQLAEGKTNGVTNPDKKHTSTCSTETRSPTIVAAEGLLPILLTKLRAEYIPNRMREQIDRAAVLSRNKATMIASVRNPSPHQPSLLPMLARIFTDENDVQLVIKPRMPTILHTTVDAQAADDMDGIDEVLQDDVADSTAHASRYIAGSRVPASRQPDLNHLFPVEEKAQDSATSGDGQPAQLRDGSPLLGAASDAPFSAFTSKRSLVAETQGNPLKRPRTDEHLVSISNVETNRRAEDTGIADREHPTFDTPRSPRPVAEEHAMTSTQPHVSLQAAGAPPPNAPSQQQSDDSDDEDFIVPQLHLRSASDDEED